MTQLVVGEDVLPLLYPVSARLHCVSLNFPVPSMSDQHLEGGHGRGKKTVWKDTVLGHSNKMFSFRSPARLYFWKSKLLLLRTAKWAIYRHERVEFFSYLKCNG